MQRAEDRSRLVPESEEPRAGLRPPTAFLLLLLVVAAVGATLYLTRPTPAPAPSNTTTAAAPDFSLTDQEAIERFEELSQLRTQAFATHDQSLLESMYTDGSVVGPVAVKEIERLTRDGVSDVSTYNTKRLTVVSNLPDEIQLKEVVVVTPRFVDAQGEDVTVGRETTREVVMWTLRLERSSWLIHDAVITRSERE